MSIFDLQQQQQPGDRNNFCSGIFIDRDRDDKPVDRNEDLRPGSLGGRREVAEIRKSGSRWRRRGRKIDHQDLPEGRVGR